MKTNNQIPIELSEANEKLIRDYAELTGMSFQAALDEVCNQLLEEHFDEWIELKKN